MTRPTDWAGFWTSRSPTRGRGEVKHSPASPPPGGKRLSEPSEAGRLEKPLASARAPVPQTDTGGLAEHAEASGETAVKELGKMAP